MKKIGIYILAVCFVFAASCGADTVKVKPLKQLQDEFLQQKFGMFLHFGTVALIDSNSIERKNGHENCI